MTFDLFTFTALIILGAVFVYLGWIHRIEDTGGRDKTEKRTVGVVELASSLFVVIGAGEYALVITLVLAYGLQGVSFLIGLAVAMLIMSFMMGRILKSVNNPLFKQVSYRGYRSVSTPDFIYLKFGRASSVVATVITAVAFWGILILQFLLGGTLISALSGAPPVWSVILMATVVILYSCKGGFSAIYFTDLWQNIIMWLGLIITIVVLFNLHWGVPEFSSAYEGLLEKSSEGWSVNVFIYFFITVMAAFSGPDLWQRANMAKSEKEAKSGLRIAALGIGMFAVLISFFVVDVEAVLSTQKAIEGGNELMQYLSLVVSSKEGVIPLELSWPDLLRVIFAIGLLSAFVSTADTSAMLVATSVQNEILRKNKNNSERIETAERSITNKLLMIASISAAIAALYTTDIAEKFTAILGILGVLGIPTFLALVGRGNAVTFLVAALTGTVILICQVFLFPSFNDGVYLFLPFLPGIFCLFVKGV